MRRTAEDAQETRNKILDAALTVFSKEGYSDTRLEDIAQEAGVTRGALYHHFGGKPEIYMALINEKFKDANLLYAQISKSFDNPSGALRSLAIELLSLLEKDEDYRKMQELVLFKTTRKPELEEGMQYKIAGTKAFVSQLETIIGKGVELGDFRGSLDIQAAALAYLGLVNGISSMWLMDTSLFSMKEKATQMIDIYIKGLK